jgi:hypothetical protein
MSNLPNDNVNMKREKTEAIAMTEEILTEGSLEEAVLQTFDSNDERILEKAPNLSSEDCQFLVYSVIGYHLGKSKFFGLTFPLEDSAHISELRALSNGYVEIKGGIVRMGVLKLENLEKILRAPFLKPGSVHLGERAWIDVSEPERSDIAQIKKELDLRRARIKKEFERRIQKFEKNVEDHRERINAYKKQKDMDIARIEQNFDEKIAALLKKQLGEEKYWRLQQLLLEKRKKEMQRFENEIQVAEDENYEKQLARLQETDPKNLIWIYFLDNKSKFREELERDIGTDVTIDGPVCIFHPGF